MGAGKPINQLEWITQIAKASCRLHASLDIPSMMREAVSGAMQLIGANAGAAGLLVDGKLSFSECAIESNWLPMNCRFDADGILANIITERTPVCIKESTVFVVSDHGHPLAEVKQLIAVPVVSAEGDWLACIVLMNSQNYTFENQDIAVLEQMALMMANALESSLRQVESKRVEADLEKSVATYRTLVEQIPAMTYIATMDRSQLLFVSPQVEVMLGYAQADFLEKKEIWTQNIHPEDRERVLGEVQQSVRDEVAFHSEYRIQTKQGEIIWVKDAADVVREHGENLYLQGVLFDISERKETEQAMVKLAHFDQLTGVANRALFRDRLKQSIVQAKRNDKQLAVLFLDLDGFKAVNDTLGHKAGDMLLAEAARRLTSHVREVDTVARMGGDEFTIILGEIHCQDDVHIVAKKIINAISEPYTHINEQAVVTLSMGVALYPQHSTHSDELVTMADDAMYEAKKNGKNQYRFTS